MSVEKDPHDERTARPRPSDEGRSIIDFAGRISRLTSVTTSVAAVTIGLVALVVVILVVILF
jgi:hypothetical protein